MQKVVIVHHRRKGPVHPTKSTLWLLMTWLLASPGHQQPWCWPNPPRTSQPQHQNSYQCGNMTYDTRQICSVYNMILILNASRRLPDKNDTSAEQVVFSYGIVDRCDKTLPTDSTQMQKHANVIVGNVGPGYQQQNIFPSIFISTYTPVHWKPGIMHCECFWMNIILCYVIVLYRIVSFRIILCHISYRIISYHIIYYIISSA